MKVKTAELEGRALDWAVAKALGLNPNFDPEARREYVGYAGFAEANGFGYAIKSYSTDWYQYGLIIDREKMDIKWVGINNCRASIEWLDGEHFEAFGPTSLVAAMRCFVASRFGDEVEVPDELMAQVETSNEPSPGDDQRPRARM